MEEQPRTRRPSSVQDIARAAGVSVGTVSNVLNNPHLVAAGTRARVEAALRSTGFVRNAAARQLKGLPSAIVGCLVLDLSNLFFAEIARGIEDRLEEEGCIVNLCSSDLKREREEQYLRVLQEVRVRGVILGTLDPAGSGLRDLVARDIPVVLLDAPRSGLPVCAVTVDNLAGGRAVAEHLLAQGHRRIALLDGGILVPSVSDRITGARQAVLARGLDPDQVFRKVSLGPPAHAGTPGPAIDAALAHPDPCTAFLCYNDMAALSIMLGLRERGLAVPGDVSVAGYDDLRFTSMVTPALTTVRQPTYEFGRAAADLLFAEGEPDHEHREVLFTPELVVRESTAPPGGGRRSR